MRKLPFLLLLPGMAGVWMYGKHWSWQKRNGKQSQISPPPPSAQIICDNFLSSCDCCYYSMFHRVSMKVSGSWQCLCLYLTMPLVQEVLKMDKHQGAKSSAKTEILEVNFHSLGNLSFQFKSILAVQGFTFVFGCQYCHTACIQCVNQLPISNSISKNFIQSVMQ